MNSSEKVDNIKNIWNEIKKLLSKLRNEHKENLDGKALWQPIKVITKDVKRTMDIKWNPKHLEIKNCLSDIIKNLPEHDDSSNIIEDNHFFLQLMNIPKKDPTVALNRLLQVSLNIGQLLPSLDDTIFGFNIVQIYDDNNLGDINTYILDEDIEKYDIDQTLINEILTILNNLAENPPLINKIGGGLLNQKSPIFYKINYFKIK